MKKYKLIKWYPSLPNTWEVGMEVGQGDRLGDFADFSPCSSFPKEKRITYSEVYNNPDFWEEVISPEFEVLIYNIDNFFPIIGNNLKISSVKRISDGKIFSLGDTVYYRNNTFIKWQIDNFHIREKDDILIIRSKDNQMVETLDHICKVDPVTFTTEDGEELTEKDEFWVVTTDKKNLVGNRSHTFPSFSKDKTNYLRFSSLDAANDYRIHNKNCLSLLDIISNVNLGLGSASKLKKLIKLKLEII